MFRAVFDAFERGDIDAAADFFAEDAVVVDPGGVHHGRAAIATLIREFSEMLPDLQVEIVDLVVNGDRLAAEVVARGIPNGQTEPVELQYCLFDVFRDGKIISEHLYVDSAQLPDGL